MYSQHDLYMDLRHGRKDTFTFEDEKFRVLNNTNSIQRVSTGHVARSMTFVESMTSYFGIAYNLIDFGCNISFNDDDNVIIDDLQYDYLDSHHPLNVCDVESPQFKSMLREYLAERGKHLPATLSDIWKPNPMWDYILPFIFLLLSSVCHAQDHVEYYLQETANITYIDEHRVIFQESKFQDADTVLHLGKLDTMIFDMNSFDVLIQVLFYDGVRDVAYVNETYCTESPNVECHGIK